MHDVRLVVPLTDLDHDAARRAPRPSLARRCCSRTPRRVRRTADKYLAHLFFEERGIPSPASWLPGELPSSSSSRFSSRRASASARGTSTAPHDRGQLDFFLDYSPVDSFVQRLCPGEEFSIDVFCDLDGRCLNAIPRTMIESKGGESIKGMTIKDWELIEFGRLGRRGAPESEAPRTSSASASLDGPARGHRREPALRRRIPASARGGQPLPGASDRPRPGRAPRATARRLSRRDRDDAVLLAPLADRPASGELLEPFAEDLPEPIASEPGDGGTQQLARTRLT